MRMSYLLRGQLLLLFPVLHRFGGIDRKLETVAKANHPDRRGFDLQERSSR